MVGVFKSVADVVRGIMNPPRYICYEVSRDTFRKNVLGSSFKGGTLVEGFSDPPSYVLVVRHD